MAKLIKPLTATQITNANPKEKMYKLFDGGGLFLQINPTGGKYWKMKYRKEDGKEGLLTFGKYPAVNRTHHLPERKRMMERWGQYLDSLRNGSTEMPPLNPPFQKSLNGLELQIVD